MRRAERRCRPLSRPETSCSKRRLHQEDEGPAVKHYLSEDAVSARLQRLSLDNDHSYGGHSFPKLALLTEPLRASSPESCPEEEDEEEEEAVLVDPGEFCMSPTEVLSVCPLLEDTLRDARPESIVPEKILRSLSSPCLELVIWSPPSSPIHHLLRSMSGPRDPPTNQPQLGKEAARSEEGMEL